MDANVLLFDHHGLSPSIAPRKSLPLDDIDVWKQRHELHVSSHVSCQVNPMAPAINEAQFAGHVGVGNFERSQLELTPNTRLLFGLVFSYCIHYSYLNNYVP